MKYIKYSIPMLLMLFISQLSIAQKHLNDHQLWDQVLQKHVSEDGWVNYATLKDDVRFEQYLAMMAKDAPDGNWSKEEAMAFWINAYNAFTAQLIIKNLPLKSIMDIENAWDKEFIMIEGKNYSLNQIEHQILRKKYFDPRIHFAVNCASYSCPKLLNRAFTAKNLEGFLNMLAKEFVNDTKRNKISADSAQLSQLFDWYRDDFARNGSLIDFINKYSKTQLNSNANISYMDYNWTLNSTANGR